MEAPETFSDDWRRHSSAPTAVVNSRKRHGGLSDDGPASGGVKPGIRYVETGDYGYDAVKDKVHLHDLHATMQHLLGFDHTVHGEVVSGLIASQQLQNQHDARASGCDVLRMTDSMFPEPLAGASCW